MPSNTDTRIVVRPISAVAHARKRSGKLASTDFGTPPLRQFVLDARRTVQATHLRGDGADPILVEQPRILHDRAHRHGRDFLDRTGGIR